MRDVHLQTVVLGVASGGTAQRDVRDLGLLDVEDKHRANVPVPRQSVVGLTVLLGDHRAMRTIEGVRRRAIVDDVPVFVPRLSAELHVLGVRGEGERLELVLEIQVQRHSLLGELEDHVRLNVSRVPELLLDLHEIVRDIFNIETGFGQYQRPMVHNRRVQILEHRHGPHIIYVFMGSSLVVCCRRTRQVLSSGHPHLVVVQRHHANLPVPIQLVRTHHVQLPGDVLVFSDESDASVNGHGQHRSQVVVVRVHDLTRLVRELVDTVHLTIGTPGVTLFQTVVINY